MRFVTLAVAALVASLSVAACSRSEAPMAAPQATPAPPPAVEVAPAAKPAPLAVYVQASTPAGAEAETWAKELRRALEARRDEFRLASREKAELAVRIDRVEKAAGERHVMRGSLLLGKTRRNFDLTYPGEIRPQAEALARNLRTFANEMKALGR
jgi:hypothetical protein